MKARGTVLRAGQPGPGLLMVEGRQYRFELENVWTSPLPLNPGQVVEVEFDRAGQIHRLASLTESQPVNAEAPNAGDVGHRMATAGKRMRAMLKRLAAGAKRNHGARA